MGLFGVFMLENTIGLDRIHRGCVVDESGFTI